MDGAWIGVVGAAVGALAGYPVQLSLAKRADRSTRAQALRADRVSAYAVFAERIMDWRRSQVDRGMLSIGTAVEKDADEPVLDENRRVRAAAWTAFYRVKLLCDDREIEQKARAVIEMTRSMKHASDRREINIVGDEVRRKLDEFLAQAAKQTVGISPIMGRGVGATRGRR